MGIKLDELQTACDSQDIEDCVFVGLGKGAGSALTKGDKVTCITYCSNNDDGLMLNALLSIAELLAAKRGMTPAELYTKLYTDFGEVQHISKAKGFETMDDMIAGENGVTLDEMQKLTKENSQIPDVSDLIKKLLGGQNGN